MVQSGHLVSQQHSRCDACVCMCAQCLPSACPLTIVVWQAMLCGFTHFALCRDSRSDTDASSTRLRRSSPCAGVFGNMPPASTVSRRSWLQKLDLAACPMHVHTSTIHPAGLKVKAVLRNVLPCVHGIPVELSSSSVRHFMVCATTLLL